MPNGANRLGDGRASSTRRLALAGQMLVAVLALEVPVAIAQSGNPQSLSTKSMTKSGTRLEALEPGSLPPRPPLRGRRAAIPFATAPYPYRSIVPETGAPFLDVEVAGRLGRQSPRTGTVLWEDETYSDSRVLLYVPRRFSLNTNARIVVFLHGNGALLDRDVSRRQAVAHQLEASGLNAVLVAPQLARDAADSSPGKFWNPGAFAAFLQEACEKLARLTGGKRQAAEAFGRLPVVIVAYSGGYAPAAWVVHHGGAEERIEGLVVFDGLYGEQQKFAEWLARRPAAYVFSAYGVSTQAGNGEFRKALVGRSVREVARPTGRLARGSVTLLAVPPEVEHRDFMTRAWVDDPLADILARLPNPLRSERRRRQ